MITNKQTPAFNPYNIFENISFDHRFSGLCGLTSQDVSNAVEMIYKNQDDKKKHILRQLTFYANGYHFCPDRCVETVFNTSTTIEYLNVSSMSSVKRSLPRLATGPYN